MTTDDKYKLEVARQRGVIKTLQDELERLRDRIDREERASRETTEELRRALKNFLLEGLR